jgi:DDE superfamily endonuclease
MAIGCIVILSSLPFILRSKIILLLLLPYTSHILQPLDVGCFKTLSQKYSAELQKRCSARVVEIESHEVVELYAKCREFAFSRENIAAGFKASGIYSLNLHAVDFRFHYLHYLQNSMGK